MILIKAHCLIYNVGKDDFVIVKNLWLFISNTWGGLGNFSPLAPSLTIMGMYRINAVKTNTPSWASSNSKYRMDQGGFQRPYNRVLFVY